MNSQRNQNILSVPTEEIRRLLARNNLLEMDQLYSWGSPIYQQHAGRCVSLGTLLNPDDGPPIQAFLKRHQGRVRLWPRMNDLRTGQIFRSLPEREWHGIGRLAEIGLNVPRRLLLAREGGFTFRSAILLEKVPPPRSIAQMLSDGTWHLLASHQQTSLLNAIVQIIQKIHRSELIWRGASSRHFYPEQLENESWKIWLIDCEGIYPQQTQKGFRNNYLKFFRSMKESGADFRTLDHLRNRIENAQSNRTAPFENQKAA